MNYTSSHFHDGYAFLESVRDTWKKARLEMNNAHFQRFLSRGEMKPRPLIETIAANKELCTQYRKEGDNLTALLVAVKNLALGAKMPSQLKAVIQKARAPLGELVPPVSPLDIVAELESCAESDVTGHASRIMKDVIRRLLESGVINIRELKSMRRTKKMQANSRCAVMGNNRQHING